MADKNNGKPLRKKPLPFKVSDADMMAANPKAYLLMKRDADKIRNKQQKKKKVNPNAPINTSRRDPYAIIPDFASDEYSSADSTGFTMGE